MERFDVVVVGARCAGSPLATILAGRGLKVCVLDKATFPSDTLSTSALQSNGVDVLDRIGVLPRVMAADPPMMTRVTAVSARAQFTLDIDPDTYGTTLGVTRPMLDTALVEAAADAGADVRTGVAVRHLKTDRGRVSGVQTTAGDLYADVVVGADGRQSTVAKQVRAAEYCTRPAGRLPTWSIYENADLGAGFFFGTKGRPAGGSNGYLGIPVDGDRFLAAVTVPMDVAGGFLEDRYRNFDAELELFPELADAVRGATRQGPVRVLQRWHSYFRTSAGPGWVLVGDAGNFKDYSLGQGMSDAMRQAETLAAAIGAGLESGDIDHHTRMWWRWRDRDAWQLYWANCLLGEPYVPPAIGDAIFRAGSRDSTAALRLAGIMNKTYTPLRGVPPRAVTAAVIGAIVGLVRNTLTRPRLVVRELRTLASVASFTTGLVIADPDLPTSARRYRGTRRRSLRRSRDR